MGERYRLGRRVVKWIESNCVYGQGDYFGKPVRLQPFQKRFILQLYEVRADGARRYKRGLLEIPKGNGKTPLSAWVGLFELCHRDSAIVPVAAASYEQADILFGDMRNCVRESPSLSAQLAAFENDVQRGVDSRAYKVAAIAGTNDGQRPSCFLADEIHEWLGNKERVHLVIANGASKRKDSLILNTTTPGADLDTLAGRMHEHGLRVNSGEVEDPDFLCVIYACPPDRYDLSDGAQLRQAVRDANPAADAFLDVEAVASRYHQIKRNDFLRYHLGWWTTTHESWLPEGAWDACVDSDAKIKEWDDVILAFDGSVNNDATALVAVSVGTRPHIEVVEAWERPSEARADWQVPILDVEQVIRDTCERFQVREVVCDPFRWKRSMQILEAEGFPMVEYPQRPERMGPATSRFEQAVMGRQLTHNGDARLARHVGNCVVKVDVRGRRITKDARESSRKIDLAVCAVMGLDRAAEDDEEVNLW